jgi:hypothetical protein
MSDDDFENTDAPDNDFAFERASREPIVFRNPHAEDCPLRDKGNWRLMHGVMVPKPGITCNCVKYVPVRDVPEVPATGTHHPVDIHDVPGSVTTRLAEAEGEDGEDEPDVDEPDENEGLIDMPALTTAGGWCAPSELLYPEIAVSRGGLSFTNWDPYKEWTKKQFRERLLETQGLLTKERKKTRKLRRKVTRLLAVVERLAGK